MNHEYGGHLVQEYYHDKLTFSPEQLEKKYGPVLQDLQDFYNGKFSGSAQSAQGTGNSPLAALSGRPKSLISFLRDKGGIKPSGETDAMDAGKSIKGLISKRGMNHDEAREALVEAGYMHEDPNAEATTSISDFHDLLDRAVRGERILPREAEAADILKKKTQQERAEEARAKQKLFEALDELGARSDWKTLGEDERRELLLRHDRGENPDDVLEELAIRRYNDEPATEPKVRKRASRDFIHDIMFKGPYNAPNSEAANPVRKGHEGARRPVNNPSREERDTAESAPVRKPSPAKPEQRLIARKPPSPANLRRLMFPYLNTHPQSEEDKRRASQGLG
jgi:hypothetical protein